VQFLQDQNIRQDGAAYIVLEEVFQHIFWFANCYSLLTCVDDVKDLILTHCCEQERGAKDSYLKFSRFPR
jgi:hypothetical protein